MHTEPSPITRPIFFAIEGIDGAGKATTTALVQDALTKRGIAVRRMSFPRYGETMASKLIEEILNAEGPFLSPYYYASAFALDRCEALRQIEQVDVIICDRYVGSNLAFQLARVASDKWGGLADWIEDYEFNRLGLPRPMLNILLQISVSDAESLIRLKAQRSYTSHEFDQFERDRSYQRTVSDVYEWMSREERCGPWCSVQMRDGANLRSPTQVATNVAELILERIGHA